MVSVISEFRSATRTRTPKVNVSFRQLEVELVRLHDLNDESGLRELYASYLRFEQMAVMELGLGETSDQTEKRARKNLDYICEVADIRNQSGKGHSSDNAVIQAAMSDQSMDPTGPVQKFYREVIGYTGFDPHMN